MFYFKNQKNHSIGPIFSDSDEDEYNEGGVATIKKVKINKKI